MSDEIPGQIKFGGRITRTQWNQMVEAEPLLDNFLPAKMKTRDGDWNPYISCDGTLTLDDGCAVNGEFGDLERYMVGQDIPFDRHSDAKYEDSAEEVSWRPGMAMPLTASSDQDGNTLSGSEEVISYFEQGLTLDQIPSPDDGGDAGIALVLLRRADPIPPFEFIEEEV